MWLSVAQGAKNPPSSSAVRFVRRCACYDAALATSRSRGRSPSRVEVLTAALGENGPNDPAGEVSVNLGSGSVSPRGHAKVIMLSPGSQGVGMQSVFTFLRAVAKHWWPLMGSGFFVLLGVFAAATNQRNPWIVRTSVILAVVLAFVATYLAWLDEHQARGKAETNLREIEDSLSDYEKEGTTLLRQPSPKGEAAIRVWGTQVLDWIDRVGKFLLDKCGKSDARDFDRMPPSEVDSSDLLRGIQELLSHRLGNLATVRRRWHDRVVRQSLPASKHDR